MTKWLKPSGQIAETNDHPANIQAAKDLKWIVYDKALVEKIEKEKKKA